MHTLKNKFKAMTLVELLAVVAILGVTSSIGAGVLKWYQPTLHLYTAAKTVRAGITTARMRAVAEQKTYGIRFVQDQNQYELVRIEGTANAQGTYPLPPSITFGNIGPFADGTVTFNKAGAPSETGSIVLQNANGDTKTVTINPSGYVHTD
ncbi:MAG: GspH/FimT family pseudopilin [Parcubacteria group bacterium]|nr:GspH/FimT family pseudopilin [Parcubacteria group bacterium]